MATCFVEKDGPAILRLLLDPAEPARVRIKAAEMLGDVGGAEVIELLRSFKVGSDRLIEKWMKA